MTESTATPQPLDGFPPQASTPSESEASPAPRLVAKEVARELGRLHQAAIEDGLIKPADDANQKRFQNHLVKARVGSAAGLFTALRCKNPATAEHSLRVALTCSAWAAATELTDAHRDTLEVAAVLHDLGKIGIPDSLLMKPGRLTPEEMTAMDCHRHLACEMLKASGAPQEVIDTVLTAAARFDGSSSDLPLTGEQIPLTARMLAIADAFDSMTTDHVYRPAKPCERALAELFDHAGKQFDPRLVRSFCDLAEKDQRLLSDQVASRWLTELANGESSEWIPPSPLTLDPRPGDRRNSGSNALFEQKLVNNMHDGVIFVDNQRKIFLWNTGAERLTGIAAGAACGRLLEPSLLQMSSSSGSLVPDTDCPVNNCIKTGVQSLDRVGVLGRSGRHVTIDLHMIPIHGEDGASKGVTILLHDASSETSLEEKCQSLHAQMTKDPLTQVANRAEFDRMLELFIDAHQETELSCSLVMADIDHFKFVNDTFGHQAGDEAIITFASLLKSMCRSGDLVSRYGGEEFAILCADCNNATAAMRADQIRKKLAETTHPKLSNHTITASFGVTELQAGDTPDTMLRRADRALLQAKDQGRNQVVQLGNGMLEEEPKRRWFALKPWSGSALIETQLTTNVPIELAIQKLRGFISDRSARILRVTEDEVQLELTESTGAKQGKLQPVQFVIEIKFDQQRETRKNTNGFAAGEYVLTLADVKIRPKRERDRRKKQVADRARMLLGSLKSYMMAKEATAEPAKAAAE